jgi:ABC-type multidrug transport system fused ATPase/permease subunit
MSRFAIDVNNVENLMLDLIRGLASVVALLITLPMLFYLQPYLSLLPIAFLPVVSILARQMTAQVTTSMYQLGQSVGYPLTPCKANNSAVSVRMTCM